MGWDLEWEDDVGAHIANQFQQSRLAPRKTVCIPSLELFSMVLGCKLLKCVLKSIQTLQLVVDVSDWSDSTIALACIRSTPNRYSTFVANRIAKVQQMLPAKKCKHVSTHQNPVDHTTRPVAAAELQNLQLWWSRPSRLQTNEISIPSQPTILEANEFKNELKRNSTKPSCSLRQLTRRKPCKQQK